MARLNQTMNKKYTLKNKFSRDLPLSILADFQYDEYFKKNNKVEEGWNSFHDDYPGKSFLIEFSQIIKDTKHAVFYFSSRCGGLCGHGCLVLYVNDASGWKYIGTLPIWDS